MQPSRTSCHVSDTRTYRCSSFPDVSRGHRGVPGPRSIAGASSSINSCRSMTDGRMTVAGHRGRPGVVRARWTGQGKALAASARVAPHLAQDPIHTYHVTLHACESGLEIRSSPQLVNVHKIVFRPVCNLLCSFLLYKVRTDIIY